MWVGAFGCVRVRACVCVYAVHSLEQTNRTWTHAGLLSTQMAEEHPLPVTTQPVLLLIHQAHNQFCCLSIEHTTNAHLAHLGLPVPQSAHRLFPGMVYSSFTTLVLLG